MAHVTEKFHVKRLKENNINIKTIYEDDGTVFEKNTDGSKNDSFKSGIRIRKEYYKGSNKIYTINNFDSRITYSFINDDEENREYLCPNCGSLSENVTNSDGCLYCGTYYNLDYDEKQLGSKHTYDTIVKSTTYRVVVLLLDLIISFIIMFSYIRYTGRTFNGYDVFKILVYTGILATVLYYIFYVVDAYIVIGPLKEIERRRNEKQKKFFEELNNLNIDKAKMFNNFNYELSKYYYDNPINKEIIDYDIIDYLDFVKEQHDNVYIKVKVQIRLVRLINNVIKEEIVKKTFKLKKNDVTLETMSGGINMIHCYNCGASIDVTSSQCSYCGKKNNYLQEWYLVD